MKKVQVKLVLVTTVMALLVALVIGSVQAQDEVTLVLWHAKQDAEGDALLAIIDAFEAANPGIKIEQVYNPSGTIQDSFVAAAGSGEGPDMIIWANDALGQWQPSGIIAPITDMVDDDLRAQVSDTGWGTFTYEGDIWGIPFSAKTLAFFYNKAFVPDAPATWAEVLELSAELAGEGMTGLAFQNGFFHSAGFLYSLDGALMNDDGTAAFAPDTPGFDAMVAYLQFHQDMYNLGQDEASGVVVDGSSPNPGFQTGTVAMVYDGIWNLAQFESDLGPDLGVAIMPALDNGNVPALFAQSEGFYANGKLADDAAKMDAFIAWGRFVTSVEGQTIAATEGGLLPINPNVQLEDPNLQVFSEQFTLGTPFPNRPEMGAFWTPMADAISAVSDGGEDPAMAAADVYELISASIAEIQGK
jgi:maltose/maltodextrin transport system substrate-binding protein